MVCWLETKHSTTRYALYLIMSLASSPLLLPKLFALTIFPSCFLSNSCLLPPILHSFFYCFIFLSISTCACPSSIPFCSIPMHPLHAFYTLPSPLFSCPHQNKKDFESILGLHTHRWDKQKQYIQLQNNSYIMIVVSCF